jgi:hypothetical protein
MRNAKTLQEMLARYCAFISSRNNDPRKLAQALTLSSETLKNIDTEAGYNASDPASSTW